MNQLNDSLLAQRMLETRERGLTWALFLQRNRWRYLILFGLFGLFLAFAALYELSIPFYLLLGLLAGSVLRDIGWLRAARRTWQFSNKVTDWEKVQRLADGAPPQVQPKRRLFLFLAIGGTALGLLLYFALSHQSAIRTAREWGRLAPFPASAEKLAVQTEGSMFTREFRVSFIATSEDIERWLQASPGTREAERTSPSPHIRHFLIEPGGGAQFAEVFVDDAQHLVMIHVYWS